MVKLTHREMQVAGLVARGLVNEEVASTLGIKVPTAKNHLWSIYRKIGVENRVQLARWLDAHDAGPGKDEGGCKDGGGQRSIGLWSYCVHRTIAYAHRSEGGLDAREPPIERRIRGES